MDISAGLIAKTAAGAAAASATAAGIIYKDKIVSLFSKSENADGGQSSLDTIHSSSSETANLTEWDKALIEKAKGPGIQFTLSSENLKEVFDDGSQTIITSFSISINDSKFSDLKSKNNNNNWTWECEIIFKKENTNRKELKDDLKDIFKKFLEKIKSSEGENKDLKVKFIEKCSGFRGDRAVNALKTLKDLGSWPIEVKGTGQEEDVMQEDNKIKSEKIFTLVEETGSTKLKINDDKKDEFDQWFLIS